MDKEENEAYVEPPETEREEKPVRLSLHLITKRHLPAEAESWTQEEVLESLHQISHLRLDRERIGWIDSLELLGPRLSNVYLQHNAIRRIEGLDPLCGLRFLTLANNRISRVENLKCLQQLLFLDLSHNCVQQVDVGELPQSLIILNLSGNPCCTEPGYRGSLIQSLPKLKQLDEEDISRQEKNEAGLEVSSEEDDDDDDDTKDEEDDETQSGTETKNQGVKKDRNTPLTEEPQLYPHKNKLPAIEIRLRDVANGMLLRSQDRLEETFKMYRRHTKEINNLRLKIKAPKKSTTAPNTQKSLES